MGIRLLVFARLMIELPYGGEYYCECVFDWVVTVTAGGKGSGCAVLVRIVVRYTRLYITGGIMGSSLLMLF